MGEWIKRREVLNAARRTSSEKLWERQYVEGDDRGQYSKRVGWDVSRNVELMWEQVKQAIVDSARGVCGSVKGGR